MTCHHTRRVEHGRRRIPYRQFIESCMTKGRTENCTARAQVQAGSPFRRSRSFPSLRSTLYFTIYDTMSPTYSKQYDREAIDGDLDSSNPLLRPATPRSSSETAPPVYPPSSSLALSPSNGERHIVEYTYSPVYPREGENQYAVGVLGRTKEVSLIP